MGFSREDVSRAAAGDIPTRTVTSEDGREVATFGLVFIGASKAGMTDLFRQVERLAVAEDVSHIGRLSRPPRLEDFKELIIEEADISALARCKPGSCQVKLSAEMMDRYGREIKWSGKDLQSRARELTKTILVDYVSAYGERGNSALIAYADRPVGQSLASNLSVLLSRFPRLARDVGDLEAYLRGFPASQPPHCEDLIYWSRRKFGPKWVILINHAMIHRTGEPDSTCRAIALKQLYANHYFQGGLELFHLLAPPTGHPARGFYLLAQSRLMIDPPRGLLAGVQRSQISSQARSGLQARLGAIRSEITRARKD
jgi:hypothetical protein